MDSEQSFCHECGASLSEGVKFCPKCGNQIFRSEGMKKTEKGNISSVDSVILKAAADHFFKDSPAWNIAREDGDTLYINYKEDDKKASCLGGCLLLMIMWPLAIVYAILGGKKGKAGNIIIRVKENNIHINGDSRIALKAYNILIGKPDLEDKVVETETIKIAKKAKNITIGVILVIFIIVAILISSNSGY